MNERDRVRKKAAKMVQCVLCPEDKCSEDCPTLQVLPYEGPLKEENIRKARKLIASGKKVDEIKESVRRAETLDAKNDLINNWVKEYDSREKEPLYHIIRKRTLLIQQQKILDEKRKILADRKKMLESAKAVLKEASAIYETEGAPVVDDESALIADEGLPGLKKCTTVLDGTSSKD